MKTICIMCPIGCALNIDESTKSVSGNLCPRGKDYGISEITCPKRVVTSIIKTNDGTISVKTNKMIDKNKIFQVLNEIKNIKITKKIETGQVLIKNVLNTDADIVVTGINKE